MYVWHRGRENNIQIMMVEEENKKSNLTTSVSVEYNDGAMLPDALYKTLSRARERDVV